MSKRLIVASLLTAACLFGHQTPAEKSGDDDGLMTWKLVNTSIFVLVLGFGILRFAPGFFQARSLDIQRAIKEATGLKIEADFRYSEIDKKMANLGDAVDRMKAAAAQEIEREHERLQQETASEVQHLADNADYEIDSLRAEGALQVKRHTAQLALAMAERRLQAHFAQNDGQDSINEFVSLVALGRDSGAKR